jgi:hypothetical protein
MSHNFKSELRIGIGAFTRREEALLTKPAVAAADRQGDHNTIPLLEVRILRADFDAAALLSCPKCRRFPCRLIAVIEMKIGATGCACSDFDYGIVRMPDIWIRHRIDADVTMTMPAQCAHQILLALFLAK